MKKLRYIFYSLLIMFVYISCTVSYSFTQGAVSRDIKTYSIYNFPNRARIINPTLSDYFAEQLKEKFTRQAGLDYQTDNGDLEFEGEIVGYDVQPMAIKSDDVASMNRLTVRIKVKYTNNKDHEQDFETEFSAYDEFSSDLILSDAEEQLVETIVKQIIEDVYNKSVGNW